MTIVGGRGERRRKGVVNEGTRVGGFGRLPDDR
jgi:hypothetical protein